MPHPTYISAQRIAAAYQRERNRVTFTVALIALALVPALLVPWIHGNDGVRNYVYARSIWFDGDLHFTNEFEHYRQAGEYEIPDRPDPITGHPGNAVGVGSSVLWSPFIIITQSLTGGDGYGRAFERAVAAGSVFYAIVGLLLLTRALLWRFGTSSALVAILGAWLGSPLVFYMYLHPSMSHACSFFLVAMLVWQIERWRDAPRIGRFFLMGVVAGLAAATRFNNAVFAALPAAAWLRTFALRIPLRERDRQAYLPRLFVAAAALAVGGMVGFLPQMAAWRYLYDAWLAGPRDYDLETNLGFPACPYWHLLLFSGWRGLFVWSPVLIAGALGFAYLLRRLRRPEDMALGLAFAAQVYVFGGSPWWWAGASFGQRFFINCVPLFAFGLAWLCRRLNAGAARKALLAYVVLSIAWSGGLAVQYIAEIIPREEPVSIRRLARNQVSEVPHWVLRNLEMALPWTREAPVPEAIMETGPESLLPAHKARP